MAPDQVVAALSLEFKDDMTTPQIESCVERIEQRLKQAHRQISIVFIKQQTERVWRGRWEQLRAADDR